MSDITCSICMDTIATTNNNVTTECGHCFHTKCLMQNVAHNGFACPCCRTAMANTPNIPRDNRNHHRPEQLLSIDSSQWDWSALSNHSMSDYRNLSQTANSPPPQISYSIYFGF